MNVYVVLMVKQVDNNFCVNDERDFYVKDVYNKKEQAIKAAEHEEKIRGKKYKAFISKHELKSKFKVKPFKTFEK